MGTRKKERKRIFKCVALFLISTFLSAVCVYAQDAANTNTSSSQAAAINELLKKSQQQADQAGKANQTPRISPAEQLQKRQAIARVKKILKTADGLGPTPDSRLAFANVLHNLMPLSNKQIITLRKLYDSSRRAAVTYPGAPPKATSTTVMVDLSPGATPPVVRLREGFITSLLFLDSTGQPWPIQAYDNGNPSRYNIQWESQNNPATLLIQSSGGYQTANLVVMLKGKTTPVTLTLLTGQKAADYRVDLRVPGMGPNATLTYGSLPTTVTPELLNVLDGISPAGAKRLQVDGGQAQAWESNGRLFLRTSLTILSPSWISTMSSPDGMHAYELMKTPVVLASENGRMVHLTIEGL